MCSYLGVKLRFPAAGFRQARHINNHSTSLEELCRSSKRMIPIRSGVREESLIWREEVHVVLLSPNPGSASPAELPPKL